STCARFFSACGDFLAFTQTVANDYGDLFHVLLPNRGTRGVESLLAEQIMFCNKLLLTKNDRLPFYVVTEVARAIHPLNPQVAIMAVPWGNLQLDELLSMPDYDFHRVALLIDELQDAIDAVLPDETDKKYDISWRVIEDDRP
ncbi:cobalamin biosynthesis protein CobW, partial [Acinetobacter baumannii]